jgi:hypothetical protein
MSRSKKKDNPTKRSHVAQQGSESDSSFAPDDDNHEDDGMDDVDSPSPTNNSEIQSEASLSARKAEFYHQVDKKIHTLEKDHKTTHVMTDDLFNDLFPFILAIKMTMKCFD